jgi:type IV fimbrial biogenesis protein FimT
MRQVMHRYSKQSGRSLTEILIACAITGIMTAMAWPSFKSITARAQARSTVAEIASELRMARQLAMARRERLLVRFDLPEQTITLRCADTETVLELYRYADKGIVVDEPSAGVDLYFHPSGRSASAATIVIHDREGQRIVVTVSLTGRVVIS